MNLYDIYPEADPNYFNKKALIMTVRHTPLILLIIWLLKTWHS